MQLYIYARSGHNFGLENVRRASALCNMLQECDPILCTADYRAATFAKSELGVKKGMGIDIIANLPNVMERGDILIYDDSNEASEVMQENMKEFCSLLYKVGNDIPFEIVDNIFFDIEETKYKKAIFFADDDYSNWFLDFCKNSSSYTLPLIWGHYFFYGNEKELGKSFKTIVEEDSYIDTVKTTKYLLTASVHTALESLASGNNPIFFIREDKEILNLDLITKYNIPTITAQNLDHLMQEYNNIIQNYPKIKRFDKFDITEIKDNILTILERFKKLQPSLEYKF